MTTQQTTQAIWWDGIGTTCLEHAGMELNLFIASKPKAKKHITRFGEAYLLPQEEITELLTFVDVLCETCRYEVGA
jgi:hypothetical protein